MIVESARWKQIVCADGCVLHPNPADCDGDLQAHHIIYSKHLRKDGYGHLVYDTRNGLPVCDRPHDNHHSGTQVLPLALLPDAVWEFAAELGMVWRLERYYASDEVAA